MFVFILWFFLFAGISFIPALLLTDIFIAERRSRKIMNRFDPYGVRNSRRSHQVGIMIDHYRQEGIFRRVMKDSYSELGLDYVKKKAKDEFKDYLKAKYGDDFNESYYTIDD